MQSRQTPPFSLCPYCGDDIKCFSNEALDISGSQFLHSRSDFLVECMGKQACLEKILDIHLGLTDKSSWDFRLDQYGAKLFGLSDHTYKPKT